MHEQICPNDKKLDVELFGGTSMFKRLLMLGLALTNFTFAFGKSFELLFVVDVGSKSIKRFDGSSGTYLGAIGAGQLLSPRGIAYLPDNSIAVVDNLSPTQSVIRRFHADTGMYLGGRHFAGDLRGMAYNRVTGKLYVAEQRIAAPARLNVLNADLTGAISGYDVPLAVFESGRDMAFYEGGTGLQGIFLATDRFFFFDAGTNLFGTNFGSPGEYLGHYYDQLASYEGINIMSMSATVHHGFDPAGLSSARDMVMGHDWAYGSGIHPSSGGVVVRYDTGFRVPVGTFGAGVLSSPTHMAIRNAPEPGSWVAIGLGLAVLVRRRRRGSNSQSE